MASFVERLSGDYYVDADAIRDSIRLRSSFNVIHLGSMMKVDVFVLKTRAFDLQAFDRATMRQVGRRTAASVPDDLRGRARDLGVDDLLERALAEAGLARS